MTLRVMKLNKELVDFLIRKYGSSVYEYYKYYNDMMLKNPMAYIAATGLQVSREDYNNWGDNEIQYSLF